MQALMPTLVHDMFSLSVPVAEKIIRPIVVYVFLVVCLRVFGKRELAQLNPFDLVVLLSLSNTVQNAIIGDDNSITGGVIGAVSLLTINWVVMWVLYRTPKLNQALEGNATTLVSHGRIDAVALKKEALTEEELVSVLNKNGFNDPGEVEMCVLEPNGTFFVKGMNPSIEQVREDALLDALERLSAQVRELKEQMDARG
ncbi:MAG: YetF domain-containing protein [Acidobacteriota bacterium]